MKKRVLAISVLTLAVALSACSKKEADPTTEAAVTEAVTEATTEATTAADETTGESDEEVQADYASGTIVKVEGNTLTIMDDFDEVDKSFDISDASIIKTFPLTEGDYVEVSFPEGAEGDVIEALKVEVIDAVLAESEDPIMIGTIKDATEDTLTLEGEDGEAYDISVANAYIVTSEAGLAIGAEAQVTYLGTPGEDDSLMGIKIVTEDSYTSDEALVNAFIGDVDSSKDGSIVLISESGDYFTFISDTLNFTSFKEGATVKVTYEGSISAKEIPATAITAAN